MVSRKEQNRVVSFPLRDSRVKDEIQREKPIRVFNRETLEEVVVEELRTSSTTLQPLTVAFLEVDDNQYLVETYGQQRAKKVDDGVSLILLRSVRKDDVVARYEAGRFVLILREAHVAAAARVCERIRTSVEQAVFAPQHGRVLRTTVSTGYATFTADTPFKKLQDLIQAAEDCLNEARQLGQNRIVGYPPEGVSRRLTKVDKDSSSD